MFTSGIHRLRVLGSAAPSLPRAGRSLLPLLGAARPRWLEQKILPGILNRALHEALACGDLDFLTGRRLGISILDIGILWVFTRTTGGLVMLPARATPEVTICGRTADFIHMASRREDPDRLFFQRRIVIDGDVELGLHTKNLLDSLEWDDLPWMLRAPLLALSGFLARENH